MVNNVPTSWEYDNSLEMLFLFYQCTDELLSEITPDTYVLPLHNALTAFREIENTYTLLKHFDIIDSYYLKYIPPIIDEFLSLTEDDYILKRILGRRLDSIRTGFTEASKRAALLEQWIGLFKQACTHKQYRDAYRNEISYLVQNTSNKNKLLLCVKNYYICLIHLGYHREYLYISAKKFFDNKNVCIFKKSQIDDFLNLYICTPKEFEFLVLMNTDVIDYLDTISNNIRIGKNVKKVDIEKERSILCKDFSVNELFKSYDNKKNPATAHEKVAIIHFKDDAYDPYSAAINLENSVNFLQTFTHYFKHFNPSKQIFKTLLKSDDGHYTELGLPRKLQKRPFISQGTIDLRIKNIMTAKSMSPESFYSLANAVSMHTEAFNSKSTTTLLRTFWTALETLFSNPSPKGMQNNVINSILPIIQKTYILKLLRTLYSQLCNALDSNTIDELGIQSFKQFVEYFSRYSETSPEMKIIYNKLTQNPLLRSRLFNIRKSFKDGYTIGKLLDKHNTKILWQLTRLYRMRNIATHLGQEMEGMEIAVNHLHNYFDYAVNYMLCKSENERYTVSVSSLAFEAKNDNRIHQELLKTGEPLSINNYMCFLFGPDESLIRFEFE